MRFSILGPLEVRDDAGHAVTFTRRLHRSALTLLLLNAGAAVCLGWPGQRDLGGRAAAQPRSIVTKLRLRHP